jgi:glycosyltransferase involved in cell wall biosynthesis
VLAVRNDAKLVIAAKISHSRYGDQHQQYVKTKPWGNSISFLFNYTNIPDLLASADIFVFATPNNSNDSLPRAILEAHSAGLPVVTTNTSGCPEIVRDGMTGFVVPYRAEALANRILFLMDQPQLRKDMGREAKKWISKNFNWEQMADEYADLFLEVRDR